MVQKTMSAYLAVLTLAPHVVADTSSAQRASICRVVQQLKDPKLAQAAADWLMKQSVPFCQLHGPLSDPLTTVLEQYIAARPQSPERALFRSIVTNFVAEQRFSKDILTSALFRIIQGRSYSLELIGLLLKHGADPNGRVTYKWAGSTKKTSLFLMVMREAFFSPKDRYDWAPIIERMLAYGADLDGLPSLFREFDVSPYPLLTLTDKRVLSLRLLLKYGMDPTVLRSNIINYNESFFNDLATELLARESALRLIEKPYVPQEIWRLIHLFEYDPTLHFAEEVSE